jgi:hypothetical protein
MAAWTTIITAAKTSNLVNERKKKINKNMNGEEGRKEGRKRRGNEKRGCIQKFPD